MNRAELFLKKNTPIILTVVGSVGVVATSVLAVKATPKALLLIEDAKKEKGDKLTVKETVLAAWKPYIPSVITGFLTITCIFGANYLNARNQASLMSAYALLDRSYKEYRDKMIEMHGEEADKNVRKALIQAKYDELDLAGNHMLFFDNLSMRYFIKTMDDVLRAEAEFLEAFAQRGYAFLNEYYDILGEPRVPYGYQTCWTHIDSDNPYNCRELEFVYERILIDNDVECWTISTNRPPTLDYVL